MLIETKDGIYTPEKLTSLPKNNIFVFGSSMKGKRCAGAAYDAAKYFFAAEGVGEGITGQSYALPTKSWNQQRLTIMQIRNKLITFFKFAWSHPDLTFWMTKIGCGYSGYEPHDIKLAIRNAMESTPFCGGPTPVDNIHFPEEFVDKPLFDINDLKNDKE